jgi:hypothetical protein
MIFAQIHRPDADVLQLPTRHRTPHSIALVEDIGMFLCTDHWSDHVGCDVRWRTLPSMLSAKGQSGERVIPSNVILDIVGHIFQWPPH